MEQLGPIGPSAMAVKSWSALPVGRCWEGARRFWGRGAVRAWGWSPKTNHRDPTGKKRRRHGAAYQARAE